MDLLRLERYRDLVDDWDAFAAYQDLPLRPTIWTNTLRLTPAELADYLARDGVETEPLSWLPGGFRLPAGSAPGRSLGRLLGLFHIQEEVSMMPIHLLDPQPGERLIDLCAAPGNKTVQAAVRMEDRGTVLANDSNPVRVRLIFQSVERLGVASVGILHQDAGNLPRAVGLFDRVLADVPCSCEGTVRKNPAILLRRWRPGWRHNTQVAILHKAVQLCRPGGRIVYATCTYAPEENEAVVEKVLRQPPAGSGVRVLPARIPGLVTSPGITAWRGDTYDPQLAGAMRIYPHQNDTGGFFIAVLEKFSAGDDGKSDRRRSKHAPRPVADVVDRLDAESFVAELEARFGIPRRVFEDVVIFRSSAKRASIASRGLELPDKPPMWMLGMPFFSTKSQFPRPASALARKLGRLARRNVIDLDDAQVCELVTRREVRLGAAQAAACDGEGYVLPRYRGFVVTVARFLADGDGGVVRGAIPKLWTQTLTNGLVEDEQNDSASS